MIMSAGKPIKQKLYLLHIFETKDLIAGTKLNIQLKSFRNDLAGIERKQKFIERAISKKQKTIDLNLTKERQKQLTGGLSISEKDVSTLLNIVYDTLAINKGFETVREIIQATEHRVKYNPILLAMLDSGTTVREILEIVDFPFKMELMEVLRNDKVTNRDKFLKIKKILEFKEIQDDMSKSLKNQMAVFGVYSAIIAGIIIGVKFYMMPVIKEKLVDGIGLDEKIMLWESVAIVNAFTMFGMVLWGIFLAFFLCYIFARPLFYRILYKLPFTKSLLQSINTLRLLMVFGFTFNKQAEFRQKIFGITNQYFPLPENKNLHKIWEIIEYNDKNLHDNLGIDFFDPLVSIGLESLAAGWPSVVDEMVDMKLKIYVVRMKSASDAISNIVQKLLLIVVGLAAMAIASVVLGVSFNAQKAFGQSQQQSQM